MTCRVCWRRVPADVRQAVWDADAVRWRALGTEDFERAKAAHEAAKRRAAQSVRAG